MDENKEELSEQQVNDVLNVFNFLEFSNSYRDSYYNRTYFTPDIVNQQMQSINMNPSEVTASQLQSALANPKGSEEILREYAMLAENTNMYYRRLVRYFSDLAAFHITFDCINIEKESDFNSKQYKEDLKVVDKFISKFDCKEEFQKIFRQLIRQGVFYGVLRKDENKYTIQELPADFCKITGRHVYGLLFDFNMEWFMNGYGVDIDMYPKIFRKMYRDVVKNNSMRYDPSQKVENRHSTFETWHQCSPADGFWAFKIQPELITITPYFAPLFTDISFAPVVKNLQHDKYFIQASKLLVGLIGFNKEAKSGQVANQINITPDMLGKFLGVARKGLNKQIGLVALPMDSIQTVDFDVDNSNLEEMQTKNIAQQSVSSYDVLHSTQKLNSHQSKLASAIDNNFVNATYDIFSNFVEYYINQETSKYKFKIRFHDFYVPDDQARVSNLFKEYAQLGIVDVQVAARAFDMNPFELMRHMSMTKSMGFDKKLITLSNLNTQSNKGSTGTGKVGRPSNADNPTADNDNTEASWARGSNELK